MVRDLQPQPAMNKLTIRSFMTPSPHTIGVDQTLTAAAALMREHRVRHLPVLDGGRLVGILSDRDVAVIGALPGVATERIAVAEAMTPDPHALSPDSALEWVAADMAAHKLGCTVVVEHGKVAGIFTTVDALRALQELLAQERRRLAPGG
jgi:acetoin utilization protein AcuB